MQAIDSLRKDIYRQADKKKAEFMQGFFRVEDRPKEDSFKGLSVPQCRSIAKKYKNLTFEEIQEILHSNIHEERLIALFILVARFEKGDEKAKKKVYEFYLKNIDNINHWDLVDASAYKIVGEFLRNKDKRILEELAGSKIWWERRIAIIATFQFLLKDKNYEETLKISKLLLHDKHDLIHKAVGWMLREGGKRISEERLKEFLNENYKEMPRTMLRYSIEKFPEELRKKYLKSVV